MSLGPQGRTKRLCLRPSPKSKASNPLHGDFRLEELDRLGQFLAFFAF